MADAKKVRRLSMLAVLAVLLACLVVAAIVARPSSSGPPRITSPTLLFSSPADVSIDVAGLTGASKWAISSPSGAVVATGRTTGGEESTIQPGSLAPGYYLFRVEGHGEAVEANFLVTEPTQSTASDFFGVTTHWGKSSFASDTWPLSRTVPLVEGLGFTSIRDEVAWASVERTRGHFEMPQHAVEMGAASRQAGFSQLLVAGYGNPNAFPGASEDGLTPPVTAAMRSSFVAYINTVLDANPNIQAVEVWNEFNRPQRNTSSCQSGKCYATLVAAVHDGVKREHPNVRIVAGNTSGTPIPWFTDFITAGGLKYADALSTHAYSNDISDLQTSIQNLDQLIRKYNKGIPLPIIVSEIGITNTTSKAPAGDVGRVADEAEASAGLTQIFVALKAMPAVSAVYWYDAIDDGTKEDDAEAHYGLFRQPSASVLSFQPKQAAGAAAVLLRDFGGYTVTSSSFEDGVRQYEFSNAAGERKTVMWLDLPFAQKSTKKVSVTFESLPGYETSSMSFLGESLSPSIPVGTTSISLSSAPIIISESVKGG